MRCSPGSRIPSPAVFGQFADFPDAEHLAEWGPGAMKDLPTWLQTVAAIVALAISMWAVLRQNSAERRRDKLRARAIAIAVYPEVLELERAIDIKRAWIRSILDQSSMLVGASIAASFENFVVEPPPMLGRQVDNLWLLAGDAGPAALRLLAMLDQYNASLSEIATRIATLGPSQWGNSAKAVDEHLGRVERTRKICEIVLKPMYEAVAKDSEAIDAA